MVSATDRSKESNWYPVWLAVRELISLKKPVETRVRRNSDWGDPVTMNIGCNAWERTYVRYYRFNAKRFGINACCRGKLNED